MRYTKNIWIKSIKKNPPGSSRTNEAVRSNNNFKVEICFSHYKLTTPNYTCIVILNTQLN